MSGGTNSNTAKVRSGFRVFGPTLTGETHLWYFPTLNDANAFAKQLCEAVRDEVVVMKYLGSWEPSAPPVEFIKAKERDDS